MNSISKAAYSGTMMSELLAKVDMALAVYSIPDRMSRICMKCGEKYGVHCGWDERCPHPESRELNRPFFIDGQTFSLIANRCEAQLVSTSGDKVGVRCNQKCEPGKTLCEEHYCE